MLPIKDYYFSVVKPSGSNGGTTPTGQLEVTANGLYDVYNYAKVNVNVSSTPVEVATASDMDALLTADNVGKIYQYTGVTDDTYTNGELYQVVEEA